MNCGSDPYKAYHFLKDCNDNSQVINMYIALAEVGFLLRSKNVLFWTI